MTRVAATGRPRPEITRAECALSIACIALTVFTLATFLIAGGGGNRPAARARAKRPASSEKAVSRESAADRPGPAVVTSPTSLVPSPPARPALAELLVDVAPRGYVELSPRSGPSGAFDIVSFTRTSPHPLQDRMVLAQSGFQQGFVRSWEKPGANGPSRLVASVFEFAGPAGARALAEYESGLVVKEDAGVAFPVDSGTGLRFVHRQGNQTIYGYSVTLGRGDGLLFYFGALSTTPQPPDEVLLVARQQLERLQQPAVGARERRLA